jgi:HD-GYP domain-containing protein (c-di-GMP phosphodiesterase class II)
LLFPKGKSYFRGDASVGRSVPTVVVFLATALLLPTLIHTVVALTYLPFSFSPLRVSIFMGATFLATLLELKPTRLAFGREVSEIALSSALYLPMLMLAGWPFAILLALFASVTSDVQLNKPWYKVTYNAANGAFSLWCAGLLYDKLATTVPIGQNSAGALLGALAAGVLYTLLNAMLVAFPLAYVQRIPYTGVLIPYIRGVAPFFAGVSSLSVAAAALWQVHPLATGLLLPALLTAKLAYDNYVRLRLETDNFLHALADAVDLRDPYTARHSVRVAELARALGERLGLQGDTLWGLQAVARVHDVGKITVPDSVLRKAGALTPEEYEEMKGHVEAGVRILQHISLYRDSLEILAQHHERLDGSGYPRGLKGEEIIFPARVLAVADAYDAMTTDRPYRRAKTPEEAVRELYRVAGKEYDLNVVRALEDELVARGVLKGPVVPAALEAAGSSAVEQEVGADAAARAARVVPLPRVGSGRKPS